MSSTESEKSGTSNAANEIPGSPPRSPQPPTTETTPEVDLRAALLEFYKVYNPERLSTIDTILEKYRGNEVELVVSLKEKYEVKEYKAFDDWMRRVQYNSNGSGKSLGTPDESRRSSTGPVVSPIPPQPSRLASTSQQSANAAPILSSLNAMQDMTKLWSGWGMGSTAPTASDPTSTSSAPRAFSSTDELLLTTRVQSLQAELQRSEAEKDNLQVHYNKLTSQVAALRKENTSLKTDTQELRNRNDQAARGYGEVTSREVQLLRDIQSLNDHLKELESTNTELVAKAELAEKQKVNKHSQLQETIQLNHRLDAQLKYFLTRSFNTYEKVSNQEVGSGEVSVAITAAGSTVSTAAAPAAGGSKSSSSVDYKAMLASLPGAAELLSALSTLDLQHSSSETSGESGTELNVKSNEELVKEVLVGRQKAHILESSFMASRLELLMEVRQRAAAEERVIEQQAEIERLQKKLSNVGTELETAFGSADTLKNQILDAVAEVATYKSLVASSDEQLTNRNNEVRELKEEITQLRNELEVCVQARVDLAANCASQVRSSEFRANEYVKAMKESISLEREDILSKFQHISQLSSELKIAVSAESQHEVQRLRDELFKARRNETQKERELAYLQRQLVDAAKKIAQVNVEKDVLTAEVAAATAKATAVANAIAAAHSHTPVPPLSGGGGGGGGAVKEGNRSASHSMDRTTSTASTNPSTGSVSAAAAALMQFEENDV